MKSLLQQVQSRISKRRVSIRLSESIVNNYYANLLFFGSLSMTVDQMRQIKFDLIATVQSQKLDKKIFAYLMSQERNKFEGYFRSSYKPVGNVPVIVDEIGAIHVKVQKKIKQLYARLGVSVVVKTGAAC